MSEERLRTGPEEEEKEGPRIGGPVPVWMWGAGVVVVLATAAWELWRGAPDHHGKHVSWWHDVPGFDALIGFVGCTLLVVVAKGIGTLIQRKEGYWDA